MFLRGVPWTKQSCRRACVGLGAEIGPVLSQNSTCAVVVQAAHGSFVFFFYTGEEAFGAHMYRIVFLAQASP